MSVCISKITGTFVYFPYFNHSPHTFLSRTRYGFITFSKPEEAYRAIDSSSKDPMLNIYDISFGGRRAFCGSHYADLGKFLFILALT